MKKVLVASAAVVLLSAVAIFIVWQRDHLGARIDELESQVRRSTVKLATTYASLDERDQTVERLIDERDSLERRLEESLARAAHDRGALEGAEAVNTQLTEAVRRAEEDFAVAQEAIAASKKESERMTAKLLTMEKALAEQSQHAQQSAQQAELARERLEQRLVDSSKALSRAEGRIVELETLLEQVEHWHAELKQEKAALQAELQHANANLSETQVLLSERNQRIEELTAERYQVEVQLAQALAEAEAAKAVIDWTQRQTVELSAFDQVQEHSAALEAEATLPAGSVERFEEELPQRTWVLGDPLSLPQATESESQRELRDKVEAQLREIAHMTGEIERLSAEREAALKLQQQFEAEMAQRDQALEALEGASEEARVELASVSARLSAVAEERDSLRARLETFDAEEDELIREVGSLREELGQANSTVETLTGRLEEGHQAEADLGGQLRAAEEQILRLSEDQRESTEKLVEYEAERMNLLDRLALEQEKSAQLSKLEAERSRLLDRLALEQQKTAQLSKLETERVDLLAELALERERSAQLNRLEEERADKVELLQQDIALLEQKLSQVQGKLSPHEGGSADVGVVQDRVRALREKYTASYLEQFKREGGESSAAEDLARVGDELFREQSLFASLVDASGIYTVRARDSLSSVALSVYGNAGRWPEIFKANEHLLTDPDKLLPGLVLVIP